MIVGLSFFSRQPYSEGCVCLLLISSLFSSKEYLASNYRIILRLELFYTVTGCSTGARILSGSIGENTTVSIILPRSRWPSPCGILCVSSNLARSCLEINLERKRTDKP